MVIPADKMWGIVSRSTAIERLGSFARFIAFYTTTARDGRYAGTSNQLKTTFE
jgi:hypothetical protein